MANLDFNPNSAVSVYDMVQARLDFPALLNSYTQAILDPSEISLRTNASNRTVLRGDNFTYTSSGGKLDITGGTITSIDIRIGDRLKLIEITDLNLSAADFGDLLSAGSVNIYDEIFKEDDTINGGGGNDRLKGFDGDDVLNGEGGNDTLFGDDGDDVLNGGAGADKLYGGNNNDILNGAGGNDLLVGGSGNDTLKGQGGADTLKGGGNNDILKGNGGNDTLVGNGGNDTLDGANGKDVLKGHAGNDTLKGGKGKDTLTGGSGDDVFVFNTALGSGNVDKVTDFKVADDTIHLDNAVFKNIADGALAAGAFVANKAGNAKDGGDRIIYETDTGKLFYDRDGSGGAYSKVHFATLDDGLSLTEADFFIL